MIIVISGTNYLDCVDNSSNRWSNTKTGSYGKGVMNNKKDPRKVERVGLLGEQAYAIYFNKEVDFSYRRGGDDYDFQLGPFTVDVKTTTMTNKAVFKYCQKSGRRVYPKCDIYVAAQLLEEQPENEVATVCLHGWLSKNELDTLATIEPGIYGYIEGEKGWLNYALYFNNLRTIEGLYQCQLALED